MAVPTATVIRVAGPRRSEAFKSSLSAALRNGRSVLLIDGWDELVDAHDLVRRLKYFTDHHAAPVVVASRPYRIVPMPISKSREWRLRPLPWPDVRTIIHRKLSDGDQSRSFEWFLRHSSLLGSLPQNPMMLELMCGCWGIPARFFRQGLLVKRCLEYLLFDSCTASATNGKSSAQLDVLARFSLNLFLSGETHFSRTDADTDLSESAIGARAVDRWLSSGLFTLTENRNGDLRFLDNAFLTHLAASAIARRGDSKVIPDLDGLMRLEWLPHWPEVVLSLASQLDAPLELLSLMAGRDRLPLLVACMREISTDWLLSFPGYGGLVVTVCQEWEKSLDDFGVETANSSWDLPLLTLFELNARQPLLRRPKTRIFATTAERLVRLGFEAGVSALVAEYFGDAARGRDRREDPTERYWAYHALGMIGGDLAISCLRDGARDESEFAAAEARESLRRLTAD